LSTQTSSVLFIGLGNMGAPMVRNLAKQVARLHLNDVAPDLAADLAVEVGGTAVTDLATVAGEVGVVILMVPSSEVISAIMDDGPGGPGLLGLLAVGTLIIDMSSSEPSKTVALAGRAAERGLLFVDAPVSGGRARAVTGELAIMAGGSDEAVEAALPLLSAMGGTVDRTGPVGSAHAMKALNNLLSAIGLAAASEVLAVGAKFGLDPSVMLGVLNRSTGRNHATETKMARYVLSRQFDSGFALNLMVKDLRIALGLAGDNGVSAPISAAALQTWIGAKEMLADHPADHTEVARFVERSANIEIR
jgi:3-hydroxyisobutyrate dehydrogenase